MTQYLRRTVTVGAVPTVIQIAGSGPVRCNASYRETAGVAPIITFRGPGGDEVDAPGANGSGVLHDVIAEQIVLTGNGAVVVIDVRNPGWLDPQFLTATVTGTVNTDIGQANTYSKDATLATIWSLFPGGKVPKAGNGGVLTGSV